MVNRCSTTRPLDSNHERATLRHSRSTKARLPSMLIAMPWLASTPVKAESFFQPLLYQVAAKMRH